MHFLHPGFEPFESFFPLGAADDLADAGNEDIHRGDGLSVIVLAHIEGFDLLRIAGNDHGFFKMLFHEVTFVFALQIDAPLDLVLEFLFLICRGLQQDVDGFGIGDPLELVVQDEM
jgi:hypothetical protein